ncbi:MAG: lysophospholipid acyltransferase family protein [Patescibacteria group bacterium]
MPKESEKDLGKALGTSAEALEIRRDHESIDVAEVPDGREVRERSRESDLDTADKVRERLLGEDTAIVPSKPSSVDAYIEKNLPERFREKQFFAGALQRVSKSIYSAFEALGLFHIRGREHVPLTGGCIAVSNHTRLFDLYKILALLGRPAHTLVADMHFEADPLRRWFLNVIGAIEVKSTLRNLSEEKKAEVLQRAPSGAKAYYAKVIERDRKPMDRETMRAHQESIQTTAAVLLKGEPVILFPEGLWLYEGGKMRKAYGGIEHIAREYRRLTGKDLPIVPVGITKGSATAGEPVVLGEGQSVHDVMKKVAELLPENERGYYGEEKES